MTATDEQLGFRKAYTYRPGSIGGLTPPEKIEAAVLEIVAAWNQKIPKNHVRILTTGRFALVRTALVKFSLAEILAAIEFYSRQPWQRRKGAFKTFDNFFYVEPPRDPPVLEWIEKAAEDAIRRRQRQRPADPRVNKLRKQVADRMGVMAEADELARRFGGMDPAGRRKLMDQAKAELVGLGRRPERLSLAEIRSHAIRVILKRMSHAGAKGSQDKRRAD